jgi:hypothetical protein
LKIQIIPRGSLLHHITVDEVAVKALMYLKAIGKAKRGTKKY